MKIQILVSKKNEASQNIKEELKKENLPFFEIEKESIYEDNIDKKIQADFFIFATTHKSEKPSKTLTVHAPGNWKKAELGGKDETICPTSALFLKHLFKILNEEQEKAHSEFSVSLEVTHHGPTLNTLCCFLEIGSSEQEWKDKTAAKIITNTLARALKEKMQEAIPALAIGGPHYCPIFNKIQLNSEYALGHIIPQYSLPLTQKMLTEALNKTKEKIEIAIIDWKGCGKSEERQQLINLLEKNNIKILRTNQIEK